MGLIVERANDTDAGDIARLWSGVDSQGVREQLLRAAMADAETFVAVARNGAVVGACVGQIQSLPRSSRERVGVLWLMCASDDSPEVLESLNDFAVDWMRSQGVDVVRLNEPASARPEAVGALGYTPFADVMALKLA